MFNVQPENENPGALAGYAAVTTNSGELFLYGGGNIETGQVCKYPIIIVT